MLETLKKRVTKNLIWRIVISAIIIGGVLLYCGQSMLQFIKGPVPITAGMDYDSAAGAYVSFDAKYVIDEYVRQSEQNTETKKEKLKNIGYFVYFEEDGYFFGIELPSSKESEMDQHIDETISWLNGEIDELDRVRSVKGTWTELTGKRLQYYQEQITDDLGEEFLEIALPYYIDTNTAGDRTFASIYVCMAALALTLIYLIYSLIRYLTGSTLARLNKYLAANPTVSMGHLEADFALASPVSNSIWTGRRWTFHVSGLYTELLENKDLVWGYYYHRSGRHSESSLRLFDVNKRMHTLSATEKEAMAALEVYGQQQPHMVLGYKKELEKMYQKDFQGFLNLRYNRPVDEFNEGFTDSGNETVPADQSTDETNSPE